MNIATLALVIRGKKILLGQKSPTAKLGANKFNAPGGGLEVGETILDCLVRETREEAAIELIPASCRKVAIVTFWAGGVPDFEVHVFTATQWNGEPKPTESMVKFKWFDRDRLPYGKMLESDQKWLPRVLRGEEFCADVYYRERAKVFLCIAFRPFVDTEHLKTAA